MEAGPTGGEASDDVSAPSGPLGIENLFVPVLAVMFAFTAGLLTYHAIAGLTAGYGRAVVSATLLIVFPLVVGVWVHRAL